jgi:uncharacterized membrane protein
LSLNIIQYKALFIVATAVFALFVASPALQRVLFYPQTEFFTELYLLGPTHTAGSYPYNITRNMPYTVYLGITNHLSLCAYYQIQVKFLNSTNSGIEVDYSNLTSLYNIFAVVGDKEHYELPIHFSMNYSFNQPYAVNFQSLTLNDQKMDLSRLTSNWNATTKTISGKLIFELWLYNATTEVFQYNSRYVNLKLNMTSV